MLGLIFLFLLVSSLFQPDNIMFTSPEDPGSTLRLCDFGTAAITDSSGRCSVDNVTLAGISPIYAPPEAISPRALATASSVFSCTTGPLTSPTVLLPYSPPPAATRAPDASDQSPVVTETFRDRDGGQLVEYANFSGFYDGTGFDVYSLGMIIWECWHQERPALTVAVPSAPEASSLLAVMAVPSNSWQLDTLAKTRAGFRPDLDNDAGPFGAMPQPLVLLLVGIHSL